MLPGNEKGLKILAAKDLMINLLATAPIWVGL